MTKEQTWAETQGELTRLAMRQLFFIGGAPRSGTTWLQRMLDLHPAVSCRGEGLFLNHLAVPLEQMMDARREELEAKNARVFRDFGGYPLPTRHEADILTGTAILLALRQQSIGRDCAAIGEKTPENAFFFPRIKQMFPHAKLIGIARDPRDVLTSAWHFFHGQTTQGDITAAKMDFIRNALPSLNDGTRALVACGENFPDDTRIVTYETIRQDPAPILSELFTFLGVPATDAIIDRCVRETAFSILSGGRKMGEARDGAFLRNGMVGDWRFALTSEMNEMILENLGWMFPHFGWTP